MIKITGTRSYIDVEVDGKEVRIQGEMIVGGFVAYKKSMVKWSFPKDELIDDETKQYIINKVIEKTKDSHMVIIFE